MQDKAMFMTDNRVHSQIKLSRATHVTFFTRLQVFFEIGATFYGTKNLHKKCKAIQKALR